MTETSISVFLLYFQGRLGYTQTKYISDIFSMRRASHIVAFVGILFVASALWLALYFFTEETAPIVSDPNDPSFGVVQTADTGPSSPVLLDQYQHALGQLRSSVEGSKDCGAAVALVEPEISKTRVPKEFLDQHLEFFLFLQQQKKEQSSDCIAAMVESLRTLEVFVSSTPRV